jgi:hypothetical protein
VALTDFLIAADHALVAADDDYAHGIPLFWLEKANLWI